MTEYMNRKVMAHAYSGPERRKAQCAPEHVVRFDAKGDPIWEVRTDHIPRRREEDDTINLLKCLVPESLSLEDEHDPAGFNPYDNGTGGV